MYAWGVGVDLMNSTARGFSISHLSTRWGADARPALLGDREQRRRPLDPPDGPQDRLWTRQPGEPLKKINLGYSKAPLPSLIDHRPMQEESCDLKFGSWVYNAGQLDLRPVGWKSLENIFFVFLFLNINLPPHRTLTRWTWRTTLAAPCGTSRKPVCSG